MSAAISANTLRRRATQREATADERDQLEAVKQALRSIAATSTQTVKSRYDGTFKAEVTETVGFTVTILVKSSETVYSQKSELPMKRGVLLNLPVWRLEQPPLSHNDLAIIRHNLAFAIWLALYNMPVKNMAELRALKLPEKWQQARV